MSQSSANFFTLANTLASAANALAAGEDGIEEHPLVRQGFSSQQLMAVAQFVAQIAQVHSAIPDPDSVGALVDRFAARMGTFPLKVVLDNKDELEEDEHRLAELLELSRVARLPAAVATADELEFYRENTLVVRGIPSMVFFQVAENSQLIGDTVTFNEIATNLMTEDPGVFGPEPRG